MRVEEVIIFGNPDVVVNAWLVVGRSVVELTVSVVPTEVLMGCKVELGPFPSLALVNTGLDRSAGALCSLRPKLRYSREFI